ncbi:MAG: hypothetical protein JO265_04295 [Acidimicrobiia bacterium]|nr:hypothetical protein [Acidimicrobiia bacterium]
MADCLASVIGALNATASAMATANGGATDVSGWTNDTATHNSGQAMPAFDDIAFQAVGVVGQPNIDWQNRPTFQQVVSFPSGRAGAPPPVSPRPAAPPAVGAGHLATTGPPSTTTWSGSLLLLAGAALLAFRRRALL